MEEVDTIIVGGGAVGLAVAEKLSRSRDNIVVIERHDGFGRETSSRNSEVIHAGIYNPETSLKGKLCVQGAPKLYELCQAQDIPHKKTGKIIVSNHESETEEIHGLFEQGRRNGVPGLELISKERVAELEPNVRCDMALFSPETGIFDTHRYMQYLENEAEGRGVIFAYGCTLEGLAKTNDGFVADIVDSDGDRMSMKTTYLVNSAGLGADSVATMAGIDLDDAG